MGIQAQDDRVLKFNSGGGIALGLGQKGGNRRPYAMLRMEQQVERIVSNARKREEEKGLHCKLHLPYHVILLIPISEQLSIACKALWEKRLGEVTKPPHANFSRSILRVLSYRPRLHTTPRTW